MWVRRDKVGEAEKEEEEIRDPGVGGRRRRKGHQIGGMKRHDEAKRKRRRGREYNTCSSLPCD